MSSRGIRDEYIKKYDDYYAGEKIKQWREIGAVGKVNNIVKLCRDYPHQNVLEIGSGEGAILQRLSEIGFGKKLFSVEVSGSGVEATKRRNIPGLIECRLYNGATIPYKDKAFDLVILSHVIEHLEHPRQVLYEAGRVADYVFIEVPCEYNIRLKKDYIPDGLGHINAYSPLTIRRLVQTSGLEVLGQEVNNMPYKSYLYMDRIFGPLRFLIKEMTLRFCAPLATKIWTYHCALICRKSPS